MKIALALVLICGAIIFLFFKSKKNLSLQPKKIGELENINKLTQKEKQAIKDGIIDFFREKDEDQAYIKEIRDFVSKGIKDE